MPAIGVEYTSTPLKAHQTEAIAVGRQALATYKGVLIADEMGLGKTLLAMHLFLAKVYRNRAKNKATRILVVAPSSVLIEWQCQLKTHLNREAFPEETLQVLVYNTKGKTTLNGEKRKERLHDVFEDNTSCIVLASYDTVRNDAQFVLRKKWHFVVMDECHRLKNNQSSTHQLFHKCLRSCSKRIGISGTPNANHPIKDLCALSQLLFATLPELHDELNYKKQKPSLLRHLIIRRTLAEVGLPLPSLHIRQVSLSFENGTIEWSAYKDQLDKTMKAMNNYIKARRCKSSNRLIALKVYQCELNMLGIVCTHYQISGVRHKELAPEDSATTTKEAYVHKVIADYAIQHGQKLIVTSVSSTFLKIVHAKMSVQHEESTILFTGETPQAQREQVLIRWRSADGPNVLLLSMKAGGVGLTLVEANRMICVDGLSQSNPAIRDQVMKRIHRMGQTRPVQIDDLCVRGTIDEVMKEAVHPSKRRVANVLLRQIPILQKRRNSQSTVNELCSIGNVLYPTWRKMIEDTSDTSPTVQLETLYQAQQKKPTEPCVSVRPTKRKAPLPHSTSQFVRRIKKKPRVV